MVVLVILVALAGISMPLFTGVRDEAIENATKASLHNLRDMIVVRYYNDMKGVAIVRNDVTTAGSTTVDNDTGVPNSLRDLVIKPLGAPDYDPVSRLGWRGPYLQPTAGKFDFARLDVSFQPYGVQDEVAFYDGWGFPVVLQWPSTTDNLSLRSQYVRLISAGQPKAIQVSGVPQLRSFIDTRRDSLMPTKPITSNLSLADERGDDRIMFLLSQDLYP